MNLDVHILYTKNSDKDDNWFNQCYESVKHSLSLTSLNYNIFVILGKVGYMSDSREFGFSFGSAEYVTYVDDDDYVNSNHFQLIEKSMHSGYDVIYFGQNVVQNNYVQPSDIHIAAVYKRSIIEKINFQKNLMHDDLIMQEHVRSNKYDVKYITEFTYNYRVYKNSTSRKIRREQIKHAKSNSRPI